MTGLWAVQGKEGWKAEEGLEFSLDVAIFPLTIAGFLRPKKLFRLNVFQLFSSYFKKEICKRPAKSTILKSPNPLIFLVLVQ